MTAGVYKITNKINKKYYLGSSIFIERRFSQHKSHLLKNKHDNKHLQGAWNKYGESNFLFEIIDILPKEKKDKVFCLEQFYLDSIEDWSKVYNKSKFVYHFPSDSRRKNAKYYQYCKYKQKYRVVYAVKGVLLGFGHFSNEEEAKLRVKHIKSLSEEDLLEYHQEFFKEVKDETVLGQKRKKGFKGYGFDKTQNRWKVQMRVDGKIKYLGSFKTEEEAKVKAKEFWATTRH